MEISGRTKLICLLGHPVEHSKSPAIHNTSFEKLGLDYRYLAFDVDRVDLRSAVVGLKTLGARGFNLTMPLKNDVVELCDELSDAAQILKSVNTVVIESDGRLFGHITDGYGLMEAVRTQANISVSGSKMVLFGAGGAAVAILAQGALDGMRQISVFCRKTSRFMPRLLDIAEEIRSRTGCIIEIHDYTEEEMRRELSDCDLLVNATNVGMAPDTDKCLIEDPEMLRPGTVVADCIYHPERTKLLSMAESRGCPVVGGKYMLLYQGAEAFRLWTGSIMPVEAVLKVL